MLFYKKPTIEPTNNIIFLPLRRSNLELNLCSCCERFNTCWKKKLEKASILWHRIVGIVDLRVLEEHLVYALSLIRLNRSTPFHYNGYTNNFITHCVPKLSFTRQKQLEHNAQAAAMIFDRTVEIMIDRSDTRPPFHIQFTRRSPYFSNKILRREYVCMKCIALTNRHTLWFYCIVDIRLLYKSIKMGHTQCKWR